MNPNDLAKMITDSGGKVESVGEIGSDGDGFMTASFPLPKDHWIYDQEYREPPAPFRVGQGQTISLNLSRDFFADKVKEAAKHAIRGATMRGKAMDFDPDALVCNLIVALLGYWTPDGK